MLDALETHYVELEDACLAYCEYGTGPDLLLLHGNSQSKRIFRRYQLEHFSSFHTIAIDSPGHGESTFPANQLCYDRCCDDVVCLCDMLALNRVSVIGYSDGGNIALLMAKKAPHLLEKAVLISPNYRVSGMTRGALTSIRLCERGLQLLSYVGINTRNVSRRLEMMLGDLPLDEDELCTINTPMTILYAEHDVVLEAHLQSLAACIPNARLQRIPRCNHLSILRRADAVVSMKQSLLS